jgi:hypothetical protein
MGDNNDDGDGGGVFGDGSGVNSLSRQGAGIDFCPSNFVCDGSGAAELYLGKMLIDLGFSHQKDYIGGRAMSGGGLGGHTTWWCGQRGACHPMVCLPVGPPSSPLWTLCHVGKNRNFRLCFVQFREYFLCNFSEIQKQQKTGTHTMSSR